MGDPPSPCGRVVQAILSPSIHLLILEHRVKGIPLNNDEDEDENEDEDEYDEYDEHDEHDEYDEDSNVSSM